MNPWRDVALSIELGDRVVAELMTLADWIAMIELTLSRTVRPSNWARAR